MASTTDLLVKICSDIFEGEGRDIEFNIVLVELEDGILYLELNGLYDSFPDKSDWSYDDLFKGVMFLVGEKQSQFDDLEDTQGIYIASTGEFEIDEEKTKEVDVGVLGKLLGKKSEITTKSKKTVKGVTVASHRKDDDSPKILNFIVDNEDKLVEIDEEKNKTKFDELTKIFWLGFKKNKFKKDEDIRAVTQIEEALRVNELKEISDISLVASLDGGKEFVPVPFPEDKIQEHAKRVKNNELLIN